MKNIIKVIAVALLSGALVPAAQAQTAVPTIAITQIVEHPDLDAARKGVLDELGEAGYSEDKAKIVYEVAQGDISTAVQIANRFAQLSPSVIIPLSTPSAQSVAKATSELPIVFGAVGDPLGAGLVEKFEKPGKNITGVAMATPVEPILDLIKKVLPDAQTIGILSNPAEANSRTTVAAMVASGEARGYKVIDQSVLSTAEIATATTDIVGRVDVIFIPTDNTMSTGADTAMKIAKSSQIPVFSAEAVAADRGALISAGLDMYQVGRSTGALAVKVLKGEKPGDLDVQPTHGLKVRVNLATAKAIGVTVPQDVLDAAAQVIE